MNESDTGPTGEDLVPVGQQLRRLLRTGKASINLYHIIQVGNGLVDPAQAACLAREIEPLLLRSLANTEPSDARGPGGSRPSPAREGVSRFDGRDTWEIGLSGKVCLYRDALGLQQLYYLLQRPGQRVAVIDLAEVRGQQVVLNQMCCEDLADDKAFAQWKGQINSLRDQREIARETGNLERVSALEIESETLARQISCARSRRGIRRRLGDQGNLLRNRVCYTVRASLQKIIGQAPELGEHLLASIKLGYECGYFPLTPVRWTLQHGPAAAGGKGPRIASSELAQ
jgi:hypothetical protein